MYKFEGKMLRIDLSTSQIQTETIDEKTYRMYLGGGGFAVKVLLTELEKNIDPLGPDNILVFAIGTIVGGPVAGASRYTVAAKSPLTNALGMTEAGGFWAPELKKAGFDLIVIKGKAPRPVYIWIKDGSVEIRDAKNIWGKDLGEAEDIIRDEVCEPKAIVAQAGPAGERLVRYACVLNNCRHANGRTGMGAVMGSKNLRAIAVKGTQNVKFYDDQKVREIGKWFADNWKSHPGNVFLNKIGTCGSLVGLNAAGILPTQNFHAGTFEHVEDISGQKMNDEIVIRNEGCYACPVRCKRVVQVSEGPFTIEPRYGGPEYETVGAFGSLCCVKDGKDIAKAHELCNKYGLDTISTGNAIAFTMECFDRGILTTKETGIDMGFGNAESMHKMIEMIVNREGFGDLLAEGTYRASQKIGKGSEKFAMHVKGQEMPLHEPRGKSLLAMAYALSPTGAEHNETPHDPDYASPGLPLTMSAPLGLYDTFSITDYSSRKVRLFAYLQFVYRAFDAIGLCKFVAAPSFALPFAKVIELIQACTGWEFSLWELNKAGERINTLERIFNIREGFGRENDKIPERFHEPLPDGPLKGVKIVPAELDEAVTSYYGIVGWDPETGIPTRGKLQELDIEWAYNYLA